MLICGKAFHKILECVGGNFPTSTEAQQNSSPVWPLWDRVESFIRIPVGCSGYGIEIYTNGARNTWIAESPPLEWNVPRMKRRFYPVGMKIEALGKWAVSASSLHRCSAASSLHDDLERTPSAYLFVMQEGYWHTCLLVAYNVQRTWCIRVLVSHNYQFHHIQTCLWEFWAWRVIQ